MIKEEVPASGISARFRIVCADTCALAEGFRWWVKNFEDRSTDNAGQSHNGRPRTASTERNKKKSMSCQREAKSDSQGNGSWDWNKASYGPEGGENLGYQKVCVRSICRFETEGHQLQFKNVYLESAGTVGRVGNDFTGLRRVTNLNFKSGLEA